MVRTPTGDNLNSTTAYLLIKTSGYLTELSYICKKFKMINEAVAKFIEAGNLSKKTVKIEFKKRNTILGIFVQSNDYEDLKSKNFWRIVTETHISEWMESKDNRLAKIFSGAEFNRVTLPKQTPVV